MFSTVFIFVVMTFSNVLTNFYFKLILDSFELNLINDVYKFLYVLIGLFVVYSLSWLSYEILATKLYARANKNIMQNAITYIKDHNSSYYNDRIAGKVSNDLLGLREATFVSFEFLEKFFARYLNFIIFLVITFSISKLIAITFTIYFIGIQLIAKKIMQGKFLKLQRYKEAQRSKFKGLVADYISNMQTVKLFNLQALELKALRKESNKLVKSVYEVDLIKLSIMKLIYYSVAVLMVAVVFYMVLTYKVNNFSIGDISFVVSFLISIEYTFDQLTEWYKEFLKNFAQIGVAIENVYAPQILHNNSNTKDYNAKSIEINFRNLNYSYENKKVFKNLNLKIEAGQKIGLVGESGAGKSTLFNILMAELKIEDSYLYFNNKDLNTINIESIRNLISYIPQETYIFNDTLLNNLTVYKKYSKAKIMDAIKKAHLTELLKELPEGLNTVLGERGVLLSGGQRQRVGIARAILEDGPILLLDEATSALDSNSEIHIQKALNDVMQNKTVIVIAHRLSTLRDMDKIIILDKGKIVESGSPKKLITSNSKFKKLWQEQTED